jgi:hypothetical protein
MKLFEGGSLGDGFVKVKEREDTFEYRRNQPFSTKSINSLRPTLSDWLKKNSCLRQNLRAPILTTCDPTDPEQQFINSSIDLHNAIEVSYRASRTEITTLFFLLSPKMLSRAARPALRAGAAVSAR